MDLVMGGSQQPDGWAAAGRHIAAAGTPAAAWQAWLARQVLPRHGEPQWLPPTRRLVVVAPHPDDEVLACGGLLHAHVHRGGEALVVAVTDGGASHTDDPAWPAPRLAARRRVESAAGLSRLTDGRPLPVLRMGCPDGAVAAHTAQLQALLEGVLRPGDMALTTWRRDGHPDHEACGHATAAAVQERHCELVEAPVWMWHWAQPGQPQVPWARLRAVSLEAEAVVRKREALAAHRSQHELRFGGQPPILDAAIRQRAAWPAEYFFVAP